MTKPYYITTPLYYVNAKPHIGHAYTNILCDTFARFHKLRGEEVFFMTGTDEHGTKIDKVAKELKKDPRKYVDEMIPEFKKLWEILGIEYDYFIRTTDENHKKTIQNVLKDLEQKGEIYKSSYKGWYCVPCESFWTKLQLLEGKCPDCRRDVQELEEENYFFKLSKHQDWLIKYITDHQDFVRPEMRKNEILGFLRQPLEDLCITRPRTRLAWGIDYPTSKDHVVYVWFDALINYVSGIGFTLDEKKFKKLWPADVHIVGKDILRHHTVYWPIMLKAMGVEMPKSVLAHGWWTMSGAKVSKSRGNAIDPIELTKKYTVDAFRYFLLREVTLGLDGAFSEDLLAERYTSDLANDLGNLWFRYAAMLEKYCEGKIPRVNQKDISPNLYAPELYERTWQRVEDAMLDYDPRLALSEIWGSLIVFSNQFVEKQQPWKMAKDAAKKEELTQTMWVLGEHLAHIALLLRAFLPNTSKKILERLSLPVDLKITSSKDFGKALLKEGTSVQRGEILFPKLDEVEPAKS